MGDQPDQAALVHHDHQAIEAAGLGNSRADKNDDRRFHRPLACELTKLCQGAVDRPSGDLTVA
jgi:hypothetical protein